ncbi:MAG: hypothetical protein ISQ89_00755, partial [Alphaproteobacteria bacterium]|nr:hypothetical protein [Alphaproteobacteria bacterium]
MLTNLKTAFKKVISKDLDKSVTNGEDVQAIIILLLEACQIDGKTDNLEINYIK